LGEQLQLQQQDMNNNYFSLGEQQKQSYPLETELYSLVEKCNELTQLHRQFQELKLAGQQMEMNIYEIEKPSLSPFEFVDQDKQQRLSLQQHAQQQVQQQVQQLKAKKQLEAQLNQLEEELALLKAVQQKQKQQRETIDIEKSLIKSTCPVCGVNVSKEVAQYEMHVCHFTD